MNYDWLIVGAWLYGAVFAHEKRAQGQRVKVIDRRPHIAGNIYTEKINGILVHKYGAHIFHTSDRKVWDYVQQFAEFNHYVNSPIARYHDELYNLPFNMNTFSKMWGVTTPAEAKAVIDRQVAEAKKEMHMDQDSSCEPRNLEEQALSLGGRDIYEKLIKGYTEKQWGRDCKELPAFIIRRLPFRFVYDNNYFNDRYQGIPTLGYTKMVENMLEGIPVETGRDFFRDVKRESDESVKRQDRKDESAKNLNGNGTGLGHGGWIMDGDHFDHLLYTGMIDEFYGCRFGALEYRSLRFETEALPDVDNWQGNAVVNYTAREIPYTRIIEHKHFEFGKDEETGSPIKGTVITREYPQAWTPGMEPYYPVNDAKNAALYEKYRSLAAADDSVLFGGRLGLYRYFDMDKVIGEALKGAACS